MNDQNARTSRGVRRAAVRWFALVTAPWAVVAPVFLLAQDRPAAVTIGLALLAVTTVLVVSALGLRRIVRQVEALDQERHGLRQAYDRARMDSLRDGLTGLGNHRAFQEELDEQLAYSRKRGTRFSIMFIDVDDLKKINDGRGHAAGDELLRATARIIASNLRRADRGYRIGGDEFAVLLPDCSPDLAVMVGRRLLATALDGGAALGDTPPFSVTIGISGFPSLGTNRQQLLRQADAALYWGKRHGRTDVQLFDPERHGNEEHLRPQEELGAAVSRVASGSLLRPVYQPLYDLRTGTVSGYEGLVRPLPEAGFPNPAALFAAAEDTGRTVELDLAALQTVLAGARDLDPTCYLSVNLSPRTLEADQFSPGELLALVRRHGIEPGRLVVELTEREEVEDVQRLRTSLATLVRHGVRIAADDVGAGNAGLRLLNEVEFNVMKVDLSLVRAGARNDSSDAILRALRELARRRHQVLVAEGVETAEQLEVIMGLGFDSAQGYLLGRPKPALDATALDLATLISSSDHPAVA